MKPPSLPPDEPHRLSRLWALHLLDTPGEERFDRITRLAQRVMKAPIALLSLVDADRQWFKSRQGMRATETSRDVSFCGHAILSDATFVVEDATQDPRFSDNPLVTGEPHVRFYAGKPIKTPAGARIGTLCVLDHEPRKLEREDELVLEDLASTIESEIAATTRAMEDELTGIASRPAYLQAGERAFAHALDGTTSLSLSCFDIDGLSGVNAAHGYDHGNLALRDTAALLVASCATGEMPARLGGDSFHVLHIGASAERVEPFARKVRADAAGWSERRGRPWALSLTTGTARFDPDRHRTFAELMAQGERALQLAKSSQGA